MTGYESSIKTAVEQKLVPFDRISEMLEYPEVQADKGLYTKLLADHGALNELATAFTAWKNSLSETEKAERALSSLTGEERDLLCDEILSLREKKDVLTGKLNRLLGADGEKQTVSVVVKAEGEKGAEGGEKLLSSLLTYFTQEGFIVQEKERIRKGKEKYARETTVTIEGADALARCLPFTGVHKVLTASAPQSFTLTAVVKEDLTVTVEEKDLKIDLFHSGGAGGQNINKVETAIRVTHLPTGTVVVCQDERSQLKNKRRAIENLTERLREKREKEEYSRVVEERRAQTADKRRKFVVDVHKNLFYDPVSQREYPFPLRATDVAEYIRNTWNNR